LDLFRNGRLFDLLLDTFTGKRRLSLRVRTLIKSVIGVAPPRVVLGWQRRRAQRRLPPMKWFGPLLRDMHPPEPPPLPDIEGGRWPSHVATSLWDRITSPQVTRAIDGTILYGSRHGIEMRLPYTDVRLAEHMLAIPWDQRIPRDHLRRTARDALGPLLPPELRKRVDQRTWMPVWTRNARKVLPLVSHLLTDGDWLSERFINRDVVGSMLRECTKRDDEDSTAWIQLLDFAALEGWLRRLI
jgi:Asparagine synthase